MEKTSNVHITLILDRSGSMSDITDQVIAGVNAFFDEQRTTGKPTTATLVQFNCRNPFEIIAANAPLDRIPVLTRERYVPQGTTPLFDAIGNGITDLSRHLATMSEKAAPDRIIFVIVTDGMENASREFTRKRITALIEEKENSGWQFVYLSSDLSAIREANSIAVRESRSIHFDKSGTSETFAMLSGKIREFSISRDGSPFDFDDREFTTPDKGSTDND